MSKNSEAEKAYDEATAAASKAYDEARAQSERKTMSKTKTVRVNTSTLAKMDIARSPGETNDQVIDRAISLLVEVKDLARRFTESPEYLAWLKRQKEQKEGG